MTSRTHYEHSGTSSGLARVPGGFLGAAALLFMLSTPWAAPPALAGALVAGLNSQIALGDGIFDIACNDVEIEPGGLLSGEQGGVILAGNWINSGTFEPGTSHITFVDGAGVCASMWTIFGSNNFYDWSVLTSTGKVLKLEPGSRQTVAHLGTFQGVLDNPLVVRSTVPGEQAFLVWLPGATAVEQFVDFVDVIVSGHGPTPTLTSTPTGPTETPTDTPTQTPTGTPADTPTVTPTPTFTRTPTPAPSEFAWIIDGSRSTETLTGIHLSGISYQQLPQLPSLTLRDSEGRLCTQPGLVPALRVDLNPQNCQRGCIIRIFPPDSTGEVAVMNIPPVTLAGTYDVLIDTHIPCEPGTTRTTLRMPNAITYVSCLGDCDGDGEVTVDDLMAGINIAHGLMSLSECPAHDRDADGAVGIHELIHAVGNLLTGCPS